MSKSKPSTIAEYIDAAPKDAQEKLREILSILKKVAPNATEAIKWGTPVLEEKEYCFRFLRTNLILISCRLAKL